MKHQVAKYAFVGLTSAGFLLAAQAITKPNTRQMAHHVKDSTVHVSVEDGTGSGWFINPRGDILTAYHVANKENKKIEVTFADGSKHPAQVVYEKKEDDIAVLHVDGVKRHAYLEFGSSKALDMTDPLIMAGFPFDTGLHISLNSVSIPLSRLADDGDKLQYTKVDGTMNPGDSGGPAVSAITGKAIGMNDAIIAPGGPFSPPQSAGIGLLVPSDTIVKDLREYQNSLDKMNFLKPIIALTIGKYQLML